jgi:arsenite-transporting ATPase
MRVILYTGKGGVGKTTAAAATALRCSELGYRTVVLSTDAAHSLSDSFDVPLGAEPVQIAPNLWGQEIDVYYSIHKYWDRLKEYLAAILSWQGVSDVLAEEIAVIPGMDEGASLLWVNQHYGSGDYDVVVVDCAPTAETLRILSIPDVGRWWFDRLFPIGKRATLILGPVVRPFLDNMPMPDREILDAAEKLFEELGAIHNLLTDPETSTMRLVLNPEKMVIKEAQRTYTYLNLYGYATDAIVCNRVMPQAVEGSYFDTWLGEQAKYLQLINESFAPLPILKSPYFEREVVGFTMLRRAADALFGAEDPSRLYFRGHAHSIEEQDGGYALLIQMPFVDKKNVSLLSSGDELTVQIGSFRRSFILPRALIGLKALGAEFEGDTLKINFGGQEQTQ